MRNKTIGLDVDLNDRDRKYGPITEGSSLKERAKMRKALGKEPVRPPGVMSPEEIISLAIMADRDFGGKKEGPEN